MAKTPKGYVKESIARVQAKVIADLRDELQQSKERERFAVEVLQRMINWLGGRDHEFSKLLVEFSKIPRTREIQKKKEEEQCLQSNSNVAAR